MPLGCRERRLCWKGPPNGNKPWQVVCVDVVDIEETHSGKRKCVVFGDRFGRGIRAFAVDKDPTSEEFLNIVAFGLVPELGVPILMISDRGSRRAEDLAVPRSVPHRVVEDRGGRWKPEVAGRSG